MKMSSKNEDKIIDINRKTPIFFLGKQRELARTTKKISNKIVYLLKKEAYLNSSQVGFTEYETLSEEWLKEAGELVKKIIKPISKDELEMIDVSELETIQDAIERRKYKARGYTDEEVEILENAGKKAIIARARMLGMDDEEVESEDFPMNNTE
jgi:hypothetical protein